MAVLARNLNFSHSDMLEMDLEVFWSYWDAIKWIGEKQEHHIKKMKTKQEVIQQRKKIRGF